MKGFPEFVNGHLLNGHEKQRIRSWRHISGGDGPAAGRNAIELAAWESGAAQTKPVHA